jgi:hypothetical protein
MKVKLRTRTTTVPAAVLGTLQSPASGSGPAVVFSEKQPASVKLAQAAIMSALPARVWNPEHALRNVFPPTVEVRV